MLLKYAQQMVERVNKLLCEGRFKGEASEKKMETFSLSKHPTYVSLSYSIFEVSCVTEKVLYKHRFQNLCKLNSVHEISWVNIS